MHREVILVVDGHDGAGKTTLARALARRLGADYVRPFAGEEGKSMLKSAEAGQVEKADRLARRMLTRALSVSATSVKVLDRHWMTVLTLLPQNLWSGWQPVPPTVLCRIDLETTLARLGDRKEECHSMDWHAQYIQRYDNLARRFGVPTLRTDRLSETDAQEWLFDWASSTVSHTQ